MVLYVPVSIIKSEFYFSFMDVLLQFLPLFWMFSFYFNFIYFIKIIFYILIVLIYFIKM